MLYKQNRHQQRNLNLKYANQNDVHYKEIQQKKTEKAKH
jgi:hypothetical protein